MADPRLIPPPRCPLLLLLPMTTTWLFVACVRAENQGDLPISTAVQLRWSSLVELLKINQLQCVDG
jgi:hypothetical protein